MRPVNECPHREEGGSHMLAVLGRRNVAVIGLALVGAALALLMLRVGPGPSSAKAASHREAPLISNDPAADITDFFMFRSTEPGQGDKVELIMDVIPGEEPSAGPNYYNFDPSVAYRFHVDNNKDGTADDVELEGRFTNEVRGGDNDAGLPLSYVALPPITSLDGQGLGLRQHYTVTMITNGRRTELGRGEEQLAGDGARPGDGEDRGAVECRTADDAGLRRARRTGHVHPRRGRARLRRTAR